MVATLGFACLVPYLIGLGGYVLIAWIPFFVLALLVIPQLVMVVIPPRLEDAYLPKHRTVLRRNVEVFTSIWLYFAFFLLASGGLARLIEGKEAFTEYLSVPLGWFDPVFKVGAKNGSLQTLGIFVTNTLVCAVFAFPFVILLRAVILRARRRAFTQLESTLLIRKMTTMMMVVEIRRLHSKPYARVNDVAVGTTIADGPAQNPQERSLAHAALIANE